MNELKTRVKDFIIETFLFGNSDGLDNQTSFLEEGVIDSTGVLELVDFIENEFSIQVLDEELVPENLDSINNTASYIERKIGSA